MSVIFQSLSASKNKNGLLTVTVNVLHGDYPGDTLKIGGKLLTLKGYSKPSNSPVESYTYSNSENILNTKVNISVIYKTVPNYYNVLDNYSLVPRNKFSPAKYPETLFKIKVGDEYACNGWTAMSILEDIKKLTGITICCPSIIDYDIDQFSIGRGVPLISAIKSLFQIPYMVVRQISEDYIIVDFPDSSLEQPDVGDVCRLVGESEVDLPNMSFIGAGHYGKPQIICEQEDYKLEHEDDFRRSYIKYIRNSFGDVAGIASSVTTVDNFISKTKLGEQLI